MDVLIAHGSEASRGKLAKTLGGQGVELVEAGLGADALDMLLAASAPRLALIDWDLPGCDGPELCRLVRAHRGAGPPYIILLARSDHRLAEGLEAGADDCVHTPADVDELRARINVGRRFAALPWERVTPAATGGAHGSSERDTLAAPELDAHSAHELDAHSAHELDAHSAPELDAQRSPDDDGDCGALPGGKLELESLLVAQ